MTDLGKKIGSFVTGSFAKLILRQKSDQEFELGQLFVAGKGKDDYTIYQIKGLFCGSQIPDNALELMAGYGLERPSSDLKIYEPELRNYVLAQARPLINIKGTEWILPKNLPQLFSDIFKIEDSHFDFFKTPKNPIILGKVRSGSEILKTDVKINAKKVLRHHVLIPATTGRGKSNLVKTILYNLMKNDKCGKLIFDPHNEYYGTTIKKGLKDHPKSSDYLDFYTIRDVSGKYDLKLNVNILRPAHIMGSTDVTRAQSEAIIGFYRRNREHWIQAIFDDTNTYHRPDGLASSTLDVLRRKISILLNFDFDTEDNIIENGIYTLAGHETTVHNIIQALMKGKTVIIDTSLFSGSEEIFIATIIVERMFNTYKNLKFKDELKGKPVITIVLEEAPRVIGKKVLEARDNVFGRIAREGRKFKIGLIGITQLPSLIDREILANMNTKIILGNEMGPERRILVESSAQDLSDDIKTIASLDIGEAIVTSNFTKFAIPIKIPKFEDLVDESEKEENDELKIRKGIPGL